RDRPGLTTSTHRAARNPHARDRRDRGSNPSCSDRNLKHVDSRAGRQVPAFCSRHRAPASTLFAGAALSVVIASLALWLRSKEASTLLEPKNCRPDHSATESPDKVTGVSV